MQLVCLLMAAAPAVLLLGAHVVEDGSWRSQLVALALWPAAGALGLTALLSGARANSADRVQTDEHDVAALETFASRYGEVTLAPVAVVIAAYDEAAGLPDVLKDLPSTVCGLDVDVVVVDDGSMDATSAAVGDKAYLVASPVNRGQGAALRLGYRVARVGGASYIVTTDADGQYDPDDFPVVLAPILDGRADFVTGSRRLGHQQTRDRFRRAGVHVFAWVVSAMTGQRHTDTSFGLRAMRAEVTAAVTLNQPQYQSSELLLGAHSHGYRVIEVPGRMCVRSAGTTKKGRNLVYGTRYARVVLGTWWREGCPRPVSERASALAFARAASGESSTDGRW
ncbi:MAG: glycosyltransferase family 2 protein [Nocardioidaceae bacterium]